MINDPATQTSRHKELPPDPATQTFNVSNDGPSKPGGCATMLIVLAALAATAALAIV